jgi:hypothetical protein
VTAPVAEPVDAAPAHAGCRAHRGSPGQVLAKLVQRMRLRITSASLEEAAPAPRPRCGRDARRPGGAGHRGVARHQRDARDLAAAGAHVVAGCRTQRGAVRWSQDRDLKRPAEGSVDVASTAGSTAPASWSRPWQGGCFGK